MQSVIIFLITFIFGVLGIVNYYVWRPEEANIVSKTITPTLNPQTEVIPKELIENPPSITEKGEITELEGEIKFQKRGSLEFESISEPQQILQGEALITGEDGSAEITFGSNIFFTLQEETEIAVWQSLPEQFVIVHRNGIVTYTNNTDSPFTIRSAPIIAILTNGEAEVIRDEEDGTVSLALTEGSMEIAYNNSDFISQIVELEEGDTFVIDIETREGEIL